MDSTRYIRCRGWGPFGEYVLDCEPAPEPSATQTSASVLVSPASPVTAPSEPAAAGPQLVTETTLPLSPAAADSDAAPTPPSPAAQTAEAETAGDSSAPPDRFCRHVSQAGRRCRYRLAERHSTFCDKHARPRRGSQEEADAIAEELLDSVEDFTTAASVNIFLGNIAVQLARKRIARTDAVALGYLSQLMINSQVAMGREQQGNLNYYGLPITPPYSAEGSHPTKG